MCEENGMKCGQKDAFVLQRIVYNECTVMYFFVDSVANHNKSTHIFQELFVV